MQELIDDLKQGNFYTHQNIKLTANFGFLQILLLTNTLGSEPEQWDDEVERIDFSSQPCQQCLNHQMIQQELKSRLQPVVYEKVSVALQTLHAELDVCNEQCDNIFLTNLIMFVLQLYKKDIKKYVNQPGDLQLKFLTDIETKLLYIVLKQFLNIQHKLASKEFNIPEKIPGNIFFQKHKHLLLAKPLKKLFIDVMSQDHTIKLLQLSLRCNEPANCLQYFFLQAVNCYFYTVFNEQRMEIIQAVFNERLSQQLKVISQRQFDILLNDVGNHFGLNIAPAGFYSTVAVQENIIPDTLDTKGRQILIWTLQRLQDNALFFLDQLKQRARLLKENNSVYPINNIINDIQIIRDTLLLISQCDSVTQADTITDIFANIQQNKQLVQEMKVV